MPSKHDVTTIQFNIRINRDLFRKYQKYCDARGLSYKTEIIHHLENLTRDIQLTDEEAAEIAQDILECIAKRRTKGSVGNSRRSKK